MSPAVPKRVYRYEVPVDDKVHTHQLSGDIVHVACRRFGVVEFWALTGCEQPRDRYFRVYGTGSDLPKVAVAHRGTDVFGSLVWHLFEGFTPDSMGGRSAAAMVMTGI